MSGVSEDITSESQDERSENGRKVGWERAGKTERSWAPKMCDDEGYIDVLIRWAMCL